MISEALELHVGGGRISRSWCMCVVGGGFGGGRDGGGSWYACVTKPGGGGVACREMPKHFGDTLMTPDHTTFQVRSSG